MAVLSAIYGHTEILFNPLGGVVATAPPNLSPKRIMG